MVVSGNVGTGKSVISAVISQRMQEARRLLGGHFCQHNNVRYRKPQLMLQSLACHLTYALPEYKNGLVEQLSRNLGVELDSMGVEELFALLFKEPISHVGDPERNILMVIDGLDESEYQGHNELLDVIANQFCKLPQWIRFFVTTRTEINIADSLEKSEGVFLYAYCSLFIRFHQKECFSSQPRAVGEQLTVRHFISLPLPFQEVRKRTLQGVKDRQRAGVAFLI